MIQLHSLPKTIEVPDGLAYCATCEYSIPVNTVPEFDASSWTPVSRDAVISYLSDSLDGPCHCGAEMYSECHGADYLPSLINDIVAHNQPKGLEATFEKHRKALKKAIKRQQK